MVSKEVIKKPKKEIVFEKQFKNVHTSIQSGEQLPIICTKKD
jgi:hypothetical protein